MFIKEKDFLLMFLFNLLKGGFKIMRKLMKRKVNLFGKEISVFVISLFAIALVSASVLQYFGMFTFIADINPTIKVDGKAEPIISHEIPEEAPGGESFCFLHKVENKASIPIDLVLDTKGDEPGDGILVKMYGVPETTTLDLCYKDTSNWACTGSKRAILTFDTVNPTFAYELDATALPANQYSLIYYPDKNAAKDWNAENIVVIDTFEGNSIVSGDVDLGINLPNTGDYNINPSPNYCNNNNGFDAYDHCRGGKIWIVLTEDITGKKLNKWNPANWLFETDLITYSDCDLYTKNVVDFTVDKEVLTDGVLETQSQTMTPMLICYYFNEMAYGIFNISSELVPAQ